jgi:hypothetical protein
MQTNAKKPEFLAEAASAVSVSSCPHRLDATGTDAVAALAGRYAR